VKLDYVKALGASEEVISQFMMEAVLLSFGGTYRGVAGVAVAIGQFHLSSQR